MEGAEWNTAALGPTKRLLAGKLLRRLADRFAPSPLLHYGQGKWYPGEQLPRWALSRSEEHTSELQSLMRISYAVFCLTKKTYTANQTIHYQTHENTQAQ